MKKYFAAAALLMMMAACGSAGQDKKLEGTTWKLAKICLLYTSDAADD